MTDEAGSPHADDLALVARAVDGDAPSRKALVEKVATVFRARAVHVRRGAPWLKTHEDDLLQRFQMKLVERGGRDLRTYAGQAPLDAWLGVVATRFLRRQAGALRPRGEVDIEVLAEPVDPTPSPESQVIRDDHAAAVRRVLGDLPERDQALLALLYEQDVPAHAAGKLLGLSPSGVRMRKSRLFEKLAKKLRHLATERSS